MMHSRFPKAMRGYDARLNHFTSLLQNILGDSQECSWNKCVYLYKPGVSKKKTTTANPSCCLSYFGAFILCGLNICGLNILPAFDAIIRDGFFGGFLGFFAGKG